MTTQELRDQLRYLDPEGDRVVRVTVEGQYGEPRAEDIVVDDGSSDHTHREMVRAAGNLNKVKVARLDIHHGNGIYAGNRRHTYLGSVGSDSETNPAPAKGRPQI